MNNEIFQAIVTLSKITEQLGHKPPTLIFEDDLYDRCVGIIVDGLRPWVQTKAEKQAIYINVEIENPFFTYHRVTVKREHAYPKVSKVLASETDGGLN